jgi:lipoate-protein ligase A
MSTWPVERLSGGAGSLHGRDALSEGRRTVTVLEVDAPALVLGSTQRDDVVDQAAARARGAEVVRWRTGGGAVLLQPDDHVWIDVTIPAGDPLWHDDVARAFTWLGTVWVQALSDLGLDGVVNERAVCHSPLGRLICFAGLGFGEVSASNGKVVGISQRRTRAGAWFQCALLRRWDRAAYAALLRPGLAAATSEPERALAEVRVHTIALDPAAVVEAFVRRLPA